MARFVMRNYRFVWIIVIISKKNRYSQESKYIVVIIKRVNAMLDCNDEKLYNFNILKNRFIKVIY